MVPRQAMTSHRPAMASIGTNPEFIGSLTCLSGFSTHLGQRSFNLGSGNPLRQRRATDVGTPCRPSFG